MNANVGYAPGIAGFIERCNRILPPDLRTWPLADQRRLYESLAVEFR